MACAGYKCRIDLSDKEKQLLRQAKKKGRKDARLVLRILMIMPPNAPHHPRGAMSNETLSADQTKCDPNPARTEGAQRRVGCMRLLGAQ